MTKFPKLQDFCFGLEESSHYNTHNTFRTNFSLLVLAKFMAFITKCDFHKNNKLYTTLDASEILSHSGICVMTKNPEHCYKIYRSGGWYAWKL